jgi:GT2 family glycosyltransferase
MWTRIGLITVTSIPVLIIPVLNRPDVLEISLRSIDHPVDDLLIIDNGRVVDDARVRLLTGDVVAHVTVLRMPHNLGVAASWNLGIKCFPHAMYWTICANDASWKPGALARVVEYARADKLLISDRGFSAFALGSDVVKQVGIFDENYQPGYYEDTDYERKIRQLNLAGCLAYPAVSVTLYDTETTMKSDPKFQIRKRRTDLSNSAYLQAKFAGPDWGRREWDLQRLLDNDWTC